MARPRSQADSSVGLEVCTRVAWSRYAQIYDLKHWEGVAARRGALISSSILEGKGKGGHPAWQRVLVAGEGAALVGAVHVS